MKQYVGAFLLQFASCNICKNQSSWEKFTAKSSGVCTKSYLKLKFSYENVSIRISILKCTYVFKHNWPQDLIEIV